MDRQLRNQIVEIEKRELRTSEIRRNLPRHVFTGNALRHDINPTNFDEFKRRYKIAVDREDMTFDFEGTTFLTRYAEICIENLQPYMPKESPH
jgi:hypothetical protein